MKRSIKIIILPIVFFSTFIFPVWGMNQDTFKIKFAREEVEVRTNEDKYVWSTWEDAVKDQGLAEASAREAGYLPRGMCCSHAVICALEYVHERSDLLASYLHKAVTGGYSDGMPLEKAMKFVTEHGVMALPKGQRVIHGSGNPWPSGKRYKFSGIFDPYVIYNEEKVSDCSDDVTRIIMPLTYPAPKSESSKVFKFILKKYNHPIVVSILSGYRGYPEWSPFQKYRGKLDTDVIGKKDLIEPWDIALLYGYCHTCGLKMKVEPVYHALILYGYKESTKRFLVKNSWGPEWNYGVCTLPYDYFDKYARRAFVGFGHDDWRGEGLYGESNGPEIAQVMCTKIPCFLDEKDEVNKYEEFMNLHKNHPACNTSEDESYWVVENYCGNSNCTEYMKNPISTRHEIGKDYVTTSKQLDAGTCKRCSKLKNVRFGFKNCRFKIKGQKSTGEIMDRSEELAHQNFHYYDPHSYGANFFQKMRVITNSLTANSLDSDEF